MIAEQIKYNKKVYWAKSKELNDAKCRQFEIFEDEALKVPATSETNALFIEKLTLKETINTSDETNFVTWAKGSGRNLGNPSIGKLNERGGAGFSTWGGTHGGGFGNPSMGRSFYGRGFGFGSSNSGSGTQSMYTYDVKPLNQTLEPQNSNNDDGMQSIHVGSVVKGKVLGKKKHITGQIQSIKQDSTNNIKYYLVRDPDTTKTYKIDPTAIFLWEPENEGPLATGQAADIFNTSGINTSGKANEGFYPRLSEEVGFKRGKNPYKTLDLGKFNTGLAESWASRYCMTHGPKFPGTMVEKYLERFTAEELDEMTELEYDNIHEIITTTVEDYMGERNIDANDVPNNLDMETGEFNIPDLI